MSITNTTPATTNTSEAAQAEDVVVASEPTETTPIVGQPLDVIPEGDEEDSASLLVHDTSDPELVEAGRIALHFLTHDVDSHRLDTLPDDETCRPDRNVFPEQPTYTYDIPDHVYHTRCANLRAGLDKDAFLADTNDSADLQYSRETLKLVHDQVLLTIQQCEDGRQTADGWHDIQVRSDADGPNSSGSRVRQDVGPEELMKNISAYVEQHFLVNKKSVIERDTDLLTQDELITHKDEVTAAIITELKTWLKYECFKRRARKTARNIVDCKWVIKWKQELLPDGSHRRIIRARLTIRGFKDVDAADLTRYAGTSQRYSQRLLCSEAANRRWPIVSTDISKAFLQGVTYQELADMTGEPLRDVCFYLPPSTIAVLKQLQGFHDFDPATEVLWCNKPGTGSVDAPRAFSLKLGKVTKNDCELEPSKTDGELLILHKNGTLMCIVTVHVDDLKITGERTTILRLVAHLEKVFGKLILQWNKFTNCGVRHIQNPTTYEITLDQIEYAAALKPITHHAMKGAKLEQIVPTDLFEQFRSLRGAVAYTLLTRADVSVYVVFLQRQQETTTNFGHIKMVNLIVKRLQEHPEKLHYGYLGPNTTFLVVTDAAFKKEDDTGHALKGTIILRRARGKLGSCLVHVIDFLTKRVGNVTRSTFSAELFSLCDACDHAMILRQICHEFVTGPITAMEARDLREGKSSSNVQIELAIDAMSVFSATTATHIKIPTEKSLLSHIQYVRELLDKRIVTSLIWLDTRDMIADGMTKGACSRDAITRAMNGSIELCHTPKQWQPLVASTAAFFVFKPVLGANAAPASETSKVEDAMPVPQGHVSIEKHTDAARRWSAACVANAQRVGQDPYVPESSRTWDSVLDYLYELMRVDAQNTVQTVSTWHEGALQDWCLRIYSLKPNTCVELPMVSDDEYTELKSSWNHIRSWHGTAPSLIPDIFRNGLKGSFGAGENDIRKFYGDYIPYVYASPATKDGRGMRCAMGYPQSMWSDVQKDHCGEGLLLDGSPPLRVVVECYHPAGSRVWERKVENNLQNAFLEDDVICAKALFYAAPKLHHLHCNRQNVRLLKELFCDVPFARPWSQVLHAITPPPPASELSGRHRRNADGSKREKEFHRRSRRAEETLTVLPVAFVSPLVPGETRPPFNAPKRGTPPAPRLSDEQRKDKAKRHLDKWRARIAQRGTQDRSVASAHEAAQPSGSTQVRTDASVSAEAVVVTPPASDHEDEGASDDEPVVLNPNDNRDADPAKWGIWDKPPQPHEPPKLEMPEPGTELARAAASGSQASHVKVEPQAVDTAQRVPREEAQQTDKKTFLKWEILNATSLRIEVVAGEDRKKIRILSPEASKNLRASVSELEDRDLDMFEYQDLVKFAQDLVQEYFAKGEYEERDIQSPPEPTLFPAAMICDKEEKTIVKWDKGRPTRMNVQKPVLKPVKKERSQSPTGKIPADSFGGRMYSDHLTSSSSHTGAASSSNTGQKTKSSWTEEEEADWREKRKKHKQSFKWPVKESK